MASISQFERASVARRLESLRKALCELGLLDLPMVEHTKRLRKVLAEIDQLQAKLTDAECSATIARE